jgi:Holliday junction resolvase-like predicted endonuclease
VKKNRCGECDAIICEGYERALNVVKIKPNKVTKKKKEIEETKQKIL